MANRLAPDALARVRRDGLYFSHRVMAFERTAARAHAGAMALRNAIIFRNAAQVPPGGRLEA
jgi:hypothetical protein